MVGRWLSRMILCAIFVTGSVGIRSRADAQTKIITVDAARKIAYEALKVYCPECDNTHVKIFRLQNKYDRDFIYFDANFDARSPKINTSPHLGYFAVNPWTGDVWNAASCVRLTSPSITKIQEEIRTRFKITKESYSDLQKRKPICNI
jgi:hypothetical protein